VSESGPALKVLKSTGAQIPHARGLAHNFRTLGFCSDGKESSLIVKLAKVAFTDPGFLPSQNSTSILTFGINCLIGDDGC
jgi:hypothetical protein